MSLAGRAEADSVSIIIPHFNHGRIIRRQIAGLMRQRLAPVEIIVVDDGSSPDKIAEVRDAIADCATARIEITGRNRGAAAACNIGLGLARGNFVAFEAADDEVLPDFVSTSVRALQQHQSAAFCFSIPATVNPETGHVRAFPLYLESGNEPTYIAAAAFPRILAGCFFTFTTLACLFRREAACAASGMPESLGGFADNFLDFVLAFRHGAVYVPEILAHYYEYSTSYSRREQGDASTMRGQTSSLLDLLAAPRFEDVREAFRRAGVLPEHRLRTLSWLLTSTEGRRFLNLTIARRCIINSAWRAVMPWTPAVLRRVLRRAATAASTGGLGS